MSGLNIKNENSPLEEKMEAALINAGLRYKSQFSLMDNSKDKWNAKYILDFLVYGEYCKVAVECDGDSYHSSKEDKEYDLRRDLWVKKRFDIDDTLRFNTAQLKYNIDGVIEQIKKALSSYDKLHYEKRKKADFNPKLIPKLVSNKSAELVVQSLGEEFSTICKNAVKTINVKDRRKKRISKEVQSLVDKKGFPKIHNFFNSFTLEDLAKARSNFDVIFGAYNSPCTINIATNTREVIIPDKIAEDPSILKIVLLYDLANVSFHGKSYIVINGVSDLKNKVVLSDILPYTKSNKDLEQLEKLLKKANKLEKELRNTYQAIYQKKSYKQSLLIQPFEHFNPKDKEKILLSISQYVRVNQRNSINKNKKSADIAVDWYKKEGIHFQETPYTFHELTIIIQYYRNRLLE